jgi:hypothetical protein
MLKIIKSNRSFETWPSWDIIHEWEDIISKDLNIPVFTDDSTLKFLRLIPIKKIRNLLCRIYIYQKTFNNDTLVFHIIPLESRFQVPKNEIPVVLDIWGHTDIELLNKVYAHCKLVMLTSKEVYDHVKGKVSFPIQYFPVTLPDQYFRGSYNTEENIDLIHKKDIDILQIGRSNAVLDKWVKKYLEEYPSTHYVYQKVVDDRIFMHSNQLGLLFERKGRNDYFELLKRSKVSVYSSAGIDDGFDRAGGFNALTPRLLECMSQFNYVIGRYADNIEYAPVREYIPNCQSYDMFEEHLSRYLHEGDVEFLQWSADFLSSKLTTSWSDFLKNNI